MNGNPGADAVVPMIRISFSNSGSASRTYANVTQSIAAQSASPDASARSTFRCDPNGVTEPKNRPSCACGATACRKAFIPLCESSPLKAARNPRQAASVVAPPAYTRADTTSTLL